MTDTKEAANPHESSDVTDVTHTNGGRAPLTASERALLSNKVARARIQRDDDAREREIRQLFPEAEA